MLRAFFLFLSGRRKIQKLVMWCSFARKAASRFVAGEDIAGAVEAVKELNAKGINSTLDHLGENVLTVEEASASTSVYLDILDVIEKNNLRSHASLKPTQMGLDLGIDVCYENVKKILQRAKEFDNFVRIDMESSEYTQVTLDLFYRLRKEFDNVGIVIQSYLYRSKGDIEFLNSNGYKVRLCKGAYKEPANTAYPRKKDVDASYVELAKLMFSKEALAKNNYPALATHDEKMISAVKSYVTEQGIDKKSFEFQMLYGIRRDIQEQLISEGYNVRVYVCYGKEWYPYFMRRLAERPANVFFLLKNLFK